MQPRDLPLLPRSASGAPGLALVVGGQAETASTTALLSSAGWRAAAVPRRSALPLAWSALVASPAVAESGGWS
jgi:hypothetical protein